MKVFIDFDSEGIEWELTNSTYKPPPFTRSFWEARLQPAVKLGLLPGMCAARACVTLAQVTLKKP